MWVGFAFVCVTLWVKICVFYKFVMCKNSEKLGRVNAVGETGRISSPLLEKKDKRCFIDEVINAGINQAFRYLGGFYFWVTCDYSQFR